MSSVESLFTQISPTYDTINHLLSLGQDLAWRKRAIRELPWQRDASFRVLDLCAGTLDYGLQLSAYYPHAEVHALDFSHAMLTHGLPKIPPRARDRHPLYCADACALPFRDGSFDLVICAYGMRNIPQPLHALAETRRVLKPGGYVSILEFFKPISFISKLFYQTYGRTLMPLVGGAISRNPAAYRYLMRSIATYFTVPEFKLLLETNGLKFIKNKEFIHGISTLIIGRKS